MKLERYKWAVPWLLAQFGVRKWLAERALHMPEKYIGGWCQYLSQVTGAEITPDRWRSVEANMIALIYDGLNIEVDA